QEANRPLLDVELVAELLLGGLRAVDLDGGDAAGLERIDLVLHQGDERADDDGGVAAQDGGGLVAERLAAAGGQDHDRVAAVEDGAHGPFPQRPEGVVAPVTFDDAFEAVEVVRRGLRGHGPDLLQNPHHTRQAYTGPDWMGVREDSGVQGSRTRPGTATRIGAPTAPPVHFIFFLDSAFRAGLRYNHSSRFHSSIRSATHAHYATPPAVRSFGLHADRAAGGDRHHRHPDRPARPRRPESPRRRRTCAMPE